jgi:hypothetical protein
VPPPSLAVVTSCVARWTFLEKSLKSWFDLPGLDAVVIATCSFDSLPIGFERAHRVVVTDNAFHRTRTLNCAVQVATSVSRADYLLITDADIIVKDPDRLGSCLGSRPDFAVDSPYALALEKGRADPEFSDRGKRGTHFVRPELFSRVNGFNQNLRGWAFDDVDLYRRYKELTSNWAFYDRDAVTHQPHSDALRQEANPQGESLMASLSRNRRLSEANFDITGKSWVDELGYDDFRYLPPEH